ncbi:MAG: type 1 glutamine amidotransferase [Solirubrobacteraceae bacterium]|nr:type 1 glutamine amidotransferase [Solirubrobacteraceae bacterium]
MAQTLEGKTIAILATDGVERVELEGPRDAIREAGGQIELIGLKAGEFQSFDHLDPSGTFVAEKGVADANADDYDGLVIPGGVANGDFLRGDDDAVSFVKGVAEREIPIASICHGPWILIEAGVTDGRTMTSWPTLQTDLRNAGADWVDREVVVDQGLVTSRKPDDIPAFSDKAIDAFAAA